jgi:competence protein ComEC
MRKCLFLATAVAMVFALPLAQAQQKKALEVYFIDVEGGQSTLFVSPSGQSLLVDTGWPGDRDAGRIAAMAKMAGVSQIDYLVLTHYHADHAGGVVTLAGLIPIKNFVDHGTPMEEVRNVPQAYAAYLKVRAEGKHILAKPGDKIPVQGLDVQVISAAQETITKPLPGAGAANPLCSGFLPKDETLDPLVGGENKASVGVVISLGKFRLGDFGDLTWNKEHDLACPNNLIAAVATFETLKSSPGLEDLWQLHYAVDAGDHNMPEKFIANQGTGGTLATGVPNEGAVNYIELAARPDGSFTVKNSRNGFHKDYAAK